ncbi:ZIP family metal transporter [Kordia sp. YSTF-M3]|uniref:ZIP family metal transporter n=1 Tax=Kordia aestuariivivens TaxID=2759037 RepID=A0ABR7Q8D7_9FLAO|nr:ZIP family metal transporter [Kordia aestuariivivens]MBC8754831.1 ZIP family metal transporter [Kordia aestuariivivens]
MIHYLLPILAVVLGFLFVTVFQFREKKHMKLLLAFSGAFLLAITVFNLLPTIFSEYQPSYGIFVMVGILLQIFLEFFSKGAEHGHVHIHKDSSAFPWLLFFSLSLHAILEGFPMHHHDHLVYGIVVHKIPIAIILTTFFYESKMSKVSILTFLFLFALMTPLGSFLSEQLTFLAAYQNEISALVIGIFLHISTTILFESSEGHKFNLTKLLVIISATIIAFFI